MSKRSHEGEMTEEEKRREIMSKGGFTEKNMEDIAESARMNSTRGKVGLGFGGGGGGTGGGGGHHAPQSTYSNPAVRGNIQLNAAAHYNNRVDTHRRLDRCSTSHLPSSPSFPQHPPPPSL